MKLNKLIPLIFLLPLACAEGELPDDMIEEDISGEELRSRDLDYRDMCDALDCPVCAKTQEEATAAGVDLCPSALQGEGWGCCTWDLDFCVPVGLNPDNSCQGMYLWCDYYTVEFGEMICHDLWGQG